MTTRTTLTLAFFAFDLFSVSIQADPVTDWNSAALDAIRIHRTPPMAARNLAIPHAAIFDAGNGISGSCRPHFVINKGPAWAAEAAAHAVLARLYPARPTHFDAVGDDGVGKGEI